MFVPINREDFITTGRSFHTDAIVRELGRLLPVATDDVALLATRGYSLRMLEDLKQLRARLQAERDVDRRNRNEAKQPMQREVALIRQAMLTLRSGSALATCSIASRRGPDGESVEAARESVSALMEHVSSLVDPCSDASRLRIRLATLRWLLTLPELNASAGETQTHAAFCEQIDIISRRLPGIAGLRVRPLVSTEFDDMDEVDGRAFVHLQLLARVGRAVFEESGQADHAALYQFRALHEV